MGCLLTADKSLLDTNDVLTSKGTAGMNFLFHDCVECGLPSTDWHPLIFEIYKMAHDINVKHMPLFIAFTNPGWEYFCHSLRVRARGKPAFAGAKFPSNMAMLILAYGILTGDFYLGLGEDVTLDDLLPLFPQGEVVSQGEVVPQGEVAPHGEVASPIEEEDEEELVGAVGGLSLEPKK
jgi:hypothetical protein